MALMDPRSLQRLYVLLWKGNSHSYKQTTQAQNGLSYLSSDNRPMLSPIRDVKATTATVNCAKYPDLATFHYSI